MTVSVAKAQKKRDSERPHHHCRPGFRGEIRISIRKLPRRENPPKTNEWRCSENLGFSLFSRLHFGPKGVTLWNHSDSFPEKSLRNPRRPPSNRQTESLKSGRRHPRRFASGHPRQEQERLPDEINVRCLRDPPRPFLFPYARRHALRGLLPARYAPACR